jgi:recombination protein RecT
MPIAPKTASLTDLRARAKLPAVQAGGSTVAQFFDANKASIAAVLPKHVSPERLMKVALGAVRTTPKLLECTTESLFGAVVQCAQLGLEPNTPLGHAYLIPFRDNRKGRTDVQVIIGYRGLLDLARRSGQIVSISAHAVRAGDLFEFEFGLDEKLRHVPAQQDAGDIIAVYAVAKLVGGGTAFDVMWRAEVDKIMKGTQSKGAYGPWKDHYEAMVRKTALRRLFKYLPVSIELSKAVEIDARGEAGKDQGLESALSGEWSVVDDDDNEEHPALEQDLAPDPEPQQQSQAKTKASKPQQTEGFDAETSRLIDLRDALGWDAATLSEYLADHHGSAEAHLDPAKLPGILTALDALYEQMAAKN